ncbi:DUF559 domain-containing protein [Actinomyces provencensis]|uniref:DUF559 domain-containing protein n=1 Tax=Actinomyces provencensis TaxID=1720198 RepID=UPI00096A4E3E|nr:DUF559 domain-containing protein [Actinomyces provencensis]
MILAVHVVVNLVVASSRSSREASRREAAGELVRVFRYVLVRTDFLDVSDRWERARRVNAVRAVAGAIVTGGGAVVGHLGAAVLHGIRTVEEFVDVHIWTSRPWGRPPVRMPEIRIRGALVAPEVTLVRHGGVNVPARPRVMDGILIADLEDVGVQCARMLAPREAVVVLSGILRVLSNFDRFEQEGSRHREEVQRTALLELLASQDDMRGRARAREVIRACDAGCESVQEALLVWILKAAGFRDVRTQVRYEVRGRSYFVDVHIGGTRVVIEFDGRAKYGHAAEDVLGAFSRQNRRQKALESLGLVVVRFEARELDDPRIVVEEVVLRAGLDRSPRPRRLLR